MHRDTSTQEQPGSPFSLARLRFTLASVGQAELPGFKGLLLRSAFGRALRLQSCEHARDARCETCNQAQDCAFAALFAPRALSPRSSLDSSSDAAPYVLHVPLADRARFGQDDLFVFEMALYGRALKHLETIVRSVERAALDGLGKMRHVFGVVRVDDGWEQRPRQVYSTNIASELASAIRTIEPDDLLRANSEPVERIRLELVTPMRIKMGGRLLRSLTLHELVRALIRRLDEVWPSAITEGLIGDMSAMVKAANKAETVEDDTRWLDIDRYSARQQTEMKFGGLVGDVAYGGDLTSLLPLVALGQLLHVGKNTTFGFGRIEILEPTVQWPFCT
jgi:hypothetical protein